jgi:long-chain acyl-CoA synthetase
LITGTALTGKVNRDKIEAAIDRVNANLPHYKQVRVFHSVEEPFTIESGLLTANGKLKRDLISQHFRDEIDAMYETPKGQASKNQAAKTA